ncbi:MAG: hypothetical protein HUK12_10970 [Muribaculaceae bacterium]|nr:hypothetical protein [Muribaculaceae bacterium]
MKAENFCFPFQAAALYYVLKTLYQQDVYKKASLACGILFGASLLIKWNISIMSLGIWASLLWHLRSGKKIAHSVTLLSAGAALIVLPIVLSFCYMGCFDEFIDAYFIKAYMAKSEHSFSDLIIKYFTEEVPDLLFFHSPLISLFAYVSVAGAIVFGLQQQRHRLVPVLLCLWHFALAARVGNYYYYLVTVVFSIFTIIAIFMRITLTQHIARSAAMAIVVLMPFVVALENGEFWRRPFLCNDPQWQKTFWEIGYKMSAVKKAKVMNFAYEIGFSTPSDALPAARFWSDIWGRNDIREVREQYVKDQVPEFITVIDARDESRSINLIVNKVTGASIDKGVGG